MIACCKASFLNDPRCPICKKFVKGEDLFEICVTDNEATEHLDVNRKLEAVLTKQRPDAPNLSALDVYKNLLREQDSLQENTALLLRQLLRETQARIREGEVWKRKAMAYQQENENLMQKHQNEMREEGQKNKKLEAILKEQQTRIQELQMKLQQVSLGRTAIPAGSSRPSTTNQYPTQTLPFVQRMRNKEEEELARERAVQQLTRPILGRGHAGGGGTLEGQRSYSAHSNGSGSYNRSGYKYNQPYPPQHERRGSSPYY